MAFRSLLARGRARVNNHGVSSSTNSRQENVYRTPLDGMLPNRPFTRNLYPLCPGQDVCLGMPANCGNSKGLLHADHCQIRNASAIVWDTVNSSTGNAKNSLMTGRLYHTTNQCTRNACGDGASGIKQHYDGAKGGKASFFVSSKQSIPGFLTGNIGLSCGAPAMQRTEAVPQKLVHWKLSHQRQGISTDSFSKYLKLRSDALKPPINTIRQNISTDSFSKNLKVNSDVLKQPLDTIKQTASKYKEAAGLQVEAFWKRNLMILVGAAGVLSCFLLWRIMYSVANIFVSFSEGMAKFGFLALAAATVAFTGMILKARFTINPDKVYRLVMRKLNTSAAALEVLGAPLTGTDVRAYVMSGGNLKLKNLKPRLNSKRCFLIFPIQGSERRGLVSAEAKKKKGKYDFKLIAIDVAAPGADQRVFLVGDEEEYKVGGGLISQLRDPILQAMAAEKEFEAQDEKEEEEDRKIEEARRESEMKQEEDRRNQEIERLEKQG